MALRKNIAAILLGFLPGVLFSCARAPLKAPSPLVPAEEGRIRGRIVAEGISLPLEGAIAQVADAKATVKSDGSFSLAEAPPGKQSLVVEKKFPSGGVRRVLGITMIFVSENPMDVRVKVRDATNVDAFCLDCHPPYGRVTRKDQVFRDVHVSGVIAKSATSDPGLLDPEGRITCESCHTPHQPGKYPFFGVANLKSGFFCNRCHGSKKQ